MSDSKKCYFGYPKECLFLISGILFRHPKLMCQYFGYPKYIFRYHKFFFGYLIYYYYYYGYLKKTRINVNSACHTRLQCRRASAIWIVNHWWHSYVIDAYLCLATLHASILQYPMVEGRKAMASWRRPPGRPRNVWINKVQEDVNALMGVGSGGYAGYLTPQLFMWRRYRYVYPPRKT